jgi:hypothetical protein
VSLAWAGLLHAAAEPETADPINGAGFELDLSALPSPHPRPVALDAARPGQTLWVRVIVPWDVVEKVPGQYDWALCDEIVRGHAAAGYGVLIAPRDGNPLHPASGPQEDGWPAFLRALAARYQDVSAHFILGDGPTALQARVPRDAAFWLKTASVAVQSGHPGARIALGDLDLGDAGAMAFLEALYAEGVDVYVDAVSVRAADPSLLGPLKQTMLARDPSARIWWGARRLPGGATAGGELLRAFLEGLSAETALTTFVLDPGPDGTPALLPVLSRIRSLLTPSHTPLVESGRGIHLITPMGAPIEARIVRLYDPEDRTVLIGYDAGAGTQRGTQAVLVVDSADVAEPRLIDVAAGEEGAAGGWQKDEEAGLTRVALPLADYPIVLRYRRFTNPLFSEEERLDVTEKRQPRVEEIIAQHQAFQAAQDALLANWRADARIDFRFRIGGSTTIDVTILNNFYFDPKVGPEFEYVEYYVNGVKWRSNHLPEFPLPQPEKVMTLPLDITLDRRYTYRLDGEETVDGYDCWVVAFEPAVPEENLYQGKIWIDKKTHARVQVTSLQTGLKAPITSNDQTDSFRPLTGPDGISYWLLSRISGQQIFSTVGRNLVVFRDVVFDHPVINDSGFAQARDRSYASDNTMVRETDQGQRFLEKTADGGRTVRSKIDRDNLFGLAGTFYNRSLDYPLPLAGVNYFNRDLWGRNIQTNIFFAGALAFGNISHPDLFGTGLEGSADLFLQGFSGEDRPVHEGEEVDEEGVDITNQSLDFGLGLPFADHWKVKWTGGVRFQGFAKGEDTEPGFVIPTDTLVTTLGMEGEYNRKTWHVGGAMRVSERSTWEFWGLPGNPDFSEEASDYVLYEGSVTKEFFLKGNHKIHAEVVANGGSDLDRFSKYNFDYFGNRLRGFGGAGLRYTNGAKAQLQYAFNLGSLIRFEATLDHARVRDRGAETDQEDGFQDFTGFGLSGQTIVGPNLILTIDWGIAVASDVKEFRGDQEIFLTVMKIFH